MSPQKSHWHTRQLKRKTRDKMLQDGEQNARVRSSLSVTSVHVSRLNSPTKRHPVAEWVKKIRSDKTHFRFKNTHRLKVTGWKKIFHANGNKGEESGYP